jgi:NAD(P)-dependent dehydrogenase (short-subunit alcohol dehydrogenase family)
MKEIIDMAGQVEGKVTLVTGGNVGIGQAAAFALAREGAKVVVANRSIAGGQETVRRITDAGGEACFIQTDVSQASDVEHLVAGTVAQYGRLDGAFHNAGYEGMRQPIAELPEDEWQRVLSVSLTGVWLCMKYVIRQMLTQGSGAIVNMSSVVGHTGRPGLCPALVASHHGVLGLTRQAALEYAQAGIRVNAVCPSVTDTPRLSRVHGDNPAMRAQMAARHPLGRITQPEDVAAAVVWLCSDAASFVTGHSLVIDGGVLAQ